MKLVILVYLDNEQLQKMEIILKAISLGLCPFLNIEFIVKIITYFNVAHCSKSMKDTNIKLGMLIHHNKVHFLKTIFLELKRMYLSRMMAIRPHCTYCSYLPFAGSVFFLRTMFVVSDFDRIKMCLNTETLNIFHLYVLYFISADIS